MANYTKGQWKASEAVMFDKGERLIESYLDDHKVRTIGKIYNYAGEEESVANANLIAAAPEMYEATKIGLDLVKAVLYEHPDDAIAQSQKIVIEKALNKVEVK